MTCNANSLLATTAIPPDRLNAALRSDEANDRESIGSGGRPLYESGQDVGFRLAWHDFERAHEVDWAKGFRAGSVTICLNLSGNGRVVHAQEPSDFAPLTGGFYVQRKTSLSA